MSKTEHCPCVPSSFPRYLTRGGPMSWDDARRVIDDYNHWAEAYSRNEMGGMPYGTIPESKEGQRQDNSRYGRSTLVWKDYANNCCAVIHVKGWCWHDGDGYGGRLADKDAIVWAGWEL